MEFQTSQVDVETEVQNDGEYVAYGKATFGPFTIKFQRGYESAYHTRGPEWVIEGPMIDQIVETSCYGLEQEMMDCIGTWDYVERTDSEVQRP